MVVPYPQTMLENEYTLLKCLLWFHVRVYVCKGYDVKCT